jgi:UDP-glucuronate decarboxylase
MERMIISGGNGFLGSFLAEKALKSGMEVTVVDNFSTSVHSYLPKEVTVVKKSVESFSTNQKFDFVAHLAARPSPEDYSMNPVDTLLSNSLGTKGMLDIARASNAVFLYTSSSEVYGEASIIPTPETYYGYVNPNGVRSCYDEGKRFSEALIMAYHREFGLDVRIERPFNVYGPRIREDGFYGRVIPRFISQALRREDITIHGDGKQTRSYLYVDDWINATWKLLTLKNLGGTVVNIGASDQISVLELANMILKLTQSRSVLRFLPPRKDDPTRRAADSTLATKLLKWEPLIGLQTGLLKTIEWFNGKAAK